MTRLYDVPWRRYVPLALVLIHGPRNNSNARAIEESDHCGTDIVYDANCTLIPSAAKMQDVPKGQYMRI